MAIITLPGQTFDQDASSIKKAAPDGPAFITDHDQPTQVPLTIIDMLAMPGAHDIEFEPPQMTGPLFRPADFS